MCELHDDGSIDGWRVALEEDFHLSFPMVFDWNGEVWMIPRPGTTTACGFTAAGCSLQNGNWSSGLPPMRNCATRFLVDRRAEALTILCSETKPDNQLYVRYRRYTLCHAVQETAALPLAEADTLPAAAPAGPFELLPDGHTICSTEIFDFCQPQCRAAVCAG